jgi:outer membrane protein W
MKSAVTAIALLLLIAGTPLLAQERAAEFTIWGSWVDMQGSTRFDDDFSTEFDSGTGAGISTNIYWSPNFSTEIAVFRLRSDSRILFADFDRYEMGRADITPFTLGVQYHFAGQSRIDPYLGGGLAYVMADDLKHQDLDFLGIGTVELDDELTWYANAGIGFHITPGFALVLDGRYIPYKPTSTSTFTGLEEELEFTPLILSVGARFRW